MCQKYIEHLIFYSINNYKEQIQQHKAINTTNEQKLEAAGIDPEIIQTVKK